MQRRQAIRADVPGQRVAADQAHALFLQQVFRGRIQARKDERLDGFDAHVVEQVVDNRGRDFAADTLAPGVLADRIEDRRAMTDFRQRCLDTANTDEFVLGTEISFAIANPPDHVVTIFVDPGARIVEPLGGGRPVTDQGLDDLGVGREVGEQLSSLGAERFEIEALASQAVIQ